MQSSQRYISLFMLFFFLLAATPSHAGVLITPARLEAVIGADGRIPEVTLLNRGPESVAVHFRLVGGGHDLVGIPRFSEEPGVIEHLTDFITLMPQECVLKAGEITKVAFQLRQPMQTGLYPALIADIIPLDFPKGGIAATTRIAIPMLLTAVDIAESAQPLLRSQALRVSQSGRGEPLQVDVEVHNLGNRHVHTGGRAVINGTQGPIAEVILPAVTILPGYARQLSAQWAPPSLPQGDYEITFIPDSAPDAATQVAVRLVRPYELAVVDVQIEQTQVIHEMPGVVLVQALIANRGNAPGDIALDLQLLSDDGAILVSDTVVGEVAADSGRLFGSSLQVGSLVPGEYLVQALVRQQGALVATWRQPVRLPATHLVQR
jgi:hypothetical protein